MARYKMFFNPSKAIRELGLPQTPPDRRWRTPLMVSTKRLREEMNREAPAFSPRNLVRRKSSVSPSAESQTNLAFTAGACETFCALIFVYGTRQIAHPGSGRSQRENLQSALLADDWPSRAGLQRPLRQNPAATPDAALHQATCLSQHLLRLGRDGRRASAISSRKKSSTACAARFRTNGSTSSKTMRQAGRGIAGAIGARPSAPRQLTRSSPPASSTRSRSFTTKPPPAR